MEEGLQSKEFTSLICGDKLPDSANELVDRFFNSIEQGMQIIGLNSVKVTYHPRKRLPLVTILYLVAQKSDQHFLIIAGHDKIRKELPEMIIDLVRGSMQ